MRQAAEWHHSVGALREAPLPPAYAASPRGNLLGETPTAAAKVRSPDRERCSDSRVSSATPAAYEARRWSALPTLAQGVICQSLPLRSATPPARLLPWPAPSGAVAAPVPRLVL